MKKALSSYVLLCFLVTSIIGPSPVYAQDFRLTAPGVMVHLSPDFSPPLLKGVKVYPNNPFRLDFILDKGNSSDSTEQLKVESTRLIKYFLASITVPEKDLWVNLSPYEKNRIIPDAFGVTEMGRDLLAQDYILKQITASVIYPEWKVGKEFWDKVYAEARKRYGTTDVPINTFNKVWIVPAKAVVYENTDSAYVVKSRLKVLLEEDYLALGKGTAGKGAVEKSKETNKLGSEIVRKVVIPILEKEVNEGKNFTQLRQVYNSLILAVWFKDKIKESLFGKVYVDQKKTDGVDIEDKSAKDKIWEQYVKAFKKGAYNYIKEDYDPVAHQMVPRKYFSGGAGLYQIRAVYSKTTDPAQLPQGISDHAMVVETNLSAFSNAKTRRDNAMNTIPDGKVKVVANVRKMFDEQGNPLPFKGTVVGAWVGEQREDDFYKRLNDFRAVFKEKITEAGLSSYFVFHSTNSIHFSIYSRTGEQPSDAEIKAFEGSSSWGPSPRFKVQGVTAVPGNWVGLTLVPASAHDMEIIQSIQSKISEITGMAPSTYMPHMNLAFQIKDMDQSDYDKVSHILEKIQPKDLGEFILNQMDVRQYSFVNTSGPATTDHDRKDPSAGLIKLISLNLKDEMDTANQKSKQNWDGQDSRIKEVILGEARTRALNINRELLTNKEDFFGLTAFLTGSSEFMKYFEQIQSVIADVLDDEEKMMDPSKLLSSKVLYADPKTAHVTLNGNIISNWYNLSEKRMVLDCVRRVTSGVSGFTIRAVGPHLMNGFAVTIEFETTGPQVIQIKDGVKSLVKRINSSVSSPDIIHASVAYIFDASKDQLLELSRRLQNLRAVHPSIPVKVEDLYITKGGKDRRFRTKEKEWRLEVKLNGDDKAAISDVGGIDLTGDKMGLQIQGEGQGVQFNFDLAMIQQLQNASGLTPVIIDIRPMTTTIPMFLGLADTQSSPQVASL